MVETSVGRVIVNQIIPTEIGFFNGIISKKSLRGLIADVIKAVGMARACEFLDGIKNLGYHMAYVAGLSFNLDDIIVPVEKKDIVGKGQDEVDQVKANYEMGFITDKERYNQVIDAWTHVNNNLKQSVMKHMTEADQGFNAVYMCLTLVLVDLLIRLLSLRVCVVLWLNHKKLELKAHRLLKIQLFQTLKKVCRYWSTSYLLTVLVKVWQILP